MSTQKPTKESREGRPARSYRVERQFGLIVGVTFAVLGCWWFYRGRAGLLSAILVGVGGLLVLLAVLLPAALVVPNRAWMGFGAALSFVITPIILAIVFFGLVTPIGLVKRLAGWDPLRRRAKPSDSYWRPYTDRQRDARHYEKMF